MHALIFDVDGTLSDTETVHLLAFNAAFAEVGLDWFWDQALYSRRLKVTGGKERLLHCWPVADPEPTRVAKSECVYRFCIRTGERTSVTARVNQ